MKKVLLVLLALLFLLSVGCTKTDPVDDTNNGVPDGATIVGLVFASPNFEMVIYIDNPNWIYYTNKETGQVYFYNPSDSDNNNMISISSYELQGDGVLQIADYWKQMEENYLEIDIVIDKEEKITIADQYEGYMHPFTYNIDDYQLTGSCIMWATEKKVYILTTTANEKAKEEIETILDNMLRSFIFNAD